MTAIAIRVYTRKRDREEKKKRNEVNQKIDISRVLVFDTETTTDQFQNLTFGSFKIFNDKSIEQTGIFYNPDIINRKQLAIIKKYCEEHNKGIYTQQEFIDWIFYPAVLDKIPIVAYNLPFDISRFIIRCSYCRGRFNGGFSLKLSDNKAFPRVKIKHLDSVKSFIELGSFLDNEERFKGVFIDVKTLVNAVTNKDFSLAEALIHFGMEERKFKREVHGIVTLKYIEYNLNDVDVTYSLFCRLTDEINKFGINLPLNRVYSAASIGKGFLKELSIKPFFEQNPDFPPKIIGNLMSAFYGGRCELRIRKTPVFVTLLDFFSTYPTLFVLMGFWDFLIAERIEYYDDTENVQKLLQDVTLEDLKDREIWKRLVCLVELCPDEDILPIRARYDEKGNAYNIAVNKVTSKKLMFYALADIIVSKLLTGKVPLITKAIKFRPIGKQGGLKEKEIFGMNINPEKMDLIKFLVEKRYELKQQEKGKLNDKGQALKILLNSTTYGIFIEMNEQDNKEELEVYSDEQFSVSGINYEQEGFYFNPIISVNIVAGARLLLGMTEAMLKRYKTIPVYCDTDSMAVPTVLAKNIIDSFRPLNPYGFDYSIFKIDKEKKWFYGICSKRYVLYDKEEDEITINDNDYKLHGLGYLSNPFGDNKNWQKSVWKDILELHYGLTTFEAIMDKYRNSYAISPLSVSNYGLLNRFELMNKDKPFTGQIKPFNFMLIGIGNNKEIKPIAPYSRNTQKAVYEPFIDYKSGKTMLGEEYWKQLDNTFYDFLNKPESKFDGDIGELKRKHIIVDKIVHIGKEAKNVETVGTLDKPEYATYEDQGNLKERIMGLSVAEARKMGIAKSTLFCMRKRIREGKEIKLKNKTKERIKELFK